MRHRVKLPKLGDTATEVVVLEWYILPGDQVIAGERLLCVETDKIDAEVVSPVTGVLVEHLVSPEDSVEVGEAIAVVEVAT